MKNLILALLFVLGIFLKTEAQYSTPGTGVIWNLSQLVDQSGGAVTFTDDTFWVNEALTIAITDTIRILDNALVKIQGGVLITVDGTWQVNAPDSVLFTAQDTLQHYLGFRFEDSDASFFINSIFEYGGGLDLVDADVDFDSCIFRNNDKSNSTGVIDLFHASPLIQNCQIYNNQGPAVLSGANSECSPYIYNNQIIANNTANTNMPQINLGTSAPDSAIYIRGNTIHGMYTNSGGIAVTTLAGGFLNCIIDSNEIVNNRYGITVYGFDIESVISNNIIADNNIENLPMQGGSGINLWGNPTNSSKISGNTIYGNLWGITITGNALPNLGQIDPDTINIGLNSIFDNGNLGTEYDLYNNTPNPVYAENNYWGTYDLDSVELVIFHYPDDESLGFVDYLPIRDTLLTHIKTLPDVPINFYPNPVENYFYIKKPDTGDSNSEWKVFIFETSGKLIYSESQYSKLAKIELGNFSRGVYIIEISDGDFKSSSKLIKQ